jgi:hypothetical protein
MYTNTRSVVGPDTLSARGFTGHGLPDDTLVWAATGVRAACLADAGCCCWPVARGQPRLPWPAARPGGSSYRLPHRIRLADSWTNATGGPLQQLGMCSTAVADEVRDLDGAQCGTVRAAGLGVCAGDSIWRVREEPTANLTGRAEGAAEPKRLQSCGSDVVRFGFGRANNEARAGN